MEVVRGNDGEGPGAFDQLVLYLVDAEAVVAATAPLRERGFIPDPDPHPYWQANGAVLYRDPDGRVLVFAPWVYGREPDPVDRDGDDHRSSTAVQPTDIFEYAGDRSALRPLFELAEDSATQLDSYIGAGRVLVARQGDAVVGRALVASALAQCRADRVTRVVVATAAADIGNLRFYQRCGFRFASVERDAFTPETGYSEPVVVDGIPLLDRVWLSQAM
jgi:GNAT superfamily N-acetyltransferase